MVYSRIVSVLATLVICISLGIQVSADSVINREKIPDIYINNTLTDFGIYSPVYESSKLYLPVRVIFESVGADVKWESGSDIAYVKLRSIEIKFSIIDKTADVVQSGEERKIYEDAVGFIRNTCYMSSEIIDTIFITDYSKLDSENRVLIQDYIPGTVTVGKNKYSRTGDEIKEVNAKVVGCTSNGYDIICKSGFLFSKRVYLKVDEETYIRYTNNTKVKWWQFWRWFE